MKANNYEAHYFHSYENAKRNWANTQNQAIMTSRLVNNTYIWQNYEQYVRPLFKEIKKMMKFTKKHAHKRTGTIAE